MITDNRIFSRNFAVQVPYFSTRDGLEPMLKNPIVHFIKGCKAHPVPCGHNVIGPDVIRPGVSGPDVSSPGMLLLRHQQPSIMISNFKFRKE